MPDGSLAVESRKEITINNAEAGAHPARIVRPEDISVSNTVGSSKVADAEIFLVGDGVVQESSGKVGSCVFSTSLRHSRPERGRCGCKQRIEKLVPGGVYPD